MTLTDAIARFETQLHADGRSPHTVSSYLRHLATFRRWLAGQGSSLEIADVTPDHLARFVTSDLVAKTVTGAARARISVNHVKSALRAFFRYVEESGGIERNPARTLRTGAANSLTPSILTVDEHARLLGATGAAPGPAARRDHVMFSVFLGTGIRISALVGLDVADVDLAARRLTIVGKGGRIESMVLSTKLQALLAGYIGDREDGPLFRSARGPRISVRQVQYRLEHWTVIAGIETRVTPHGLRHAFGTRLYAATRDLRLVQRALHHRSVTSTEFYAHLADDRLAAAMEALGLVPLASPGWLSTMAPPSPEESP